MIGQVKCGGKKVAAGQKSVKSIGDETKMVEAGGHGYVAVEFAAGKRLR
ncbi:MAG TPA: hypothetical protein VEM15_04880 [Thermodesulfobacteriota bacterium]|nr:hypothetical protein [Thermodesulfobacteriota bacterium]